MSIGIKSKPKSSEEEQGTVTLWKDKLIDNFIHRPSILLKVRSSMPIQLPSDTSPLNVELQLAALNIFFIHDMFGKLKNKKDCQFGKNFSKHTRL